MTDNAKKLLNYIKTTIGIKYSEMPNYYHSLPVCILDDIYSLQSKYETITFPTIKRYADHFLNGDLYTPDYSIDAFIADLDREGLTNVMMNVLNNRQFVGGRRKIDVCYEVAKKLQSLGIQTFDDFNNYKDKGYLTYSLKTIKGVGDAATDYLFLLVGDDYRVKPDVHIHRCIRDALGHDVSNEECQILFREISQALINDMPYATPRFLDGLVWTHYSKAKFIQNS